MYMHKHKGVLKKGKEVNHPIDRVHKDSLVRRYHNTSLMVRDFKYNQPVLTKKKVMKVVLKKKSGLRMSAAVKSTTSRAKEFVKGVKKLVRQMPQTTEVPLDKNGYMFIDLTTTQHKGLKVKFVRTETVKGRRTKRTVGLQIEA